MQQRVWHRAESVVPHRPRMLLVDEVALDGDREGEARTMVKADWPVLAPGGRLLEAAFFELMAQSYAAVSGLGQPLNGAGDSPRPGFLVGLKRITILGRAFVGDQLRIRVRGVAELGDFAVFEGEVLKEGEVLACGQVKVFSPPV